MFPKDAHFICRKCLKQFAVPAENFRTIANTGVLGCPHCRVEYTSGKHITEFFTFYPRLTNMTKSLDLDGFKLKMWIFRGSEPYGSFELHYIDELLFTCQECGQTLLMEKDSRFPTDPGKWHCDQCGAKPRSAVIKEFWSYLKHVDNSQSLLGGDGLQFDLFSPVGKDPFEFVHWKHSSGTVE